MYVSLLIKHRKSVINFQIKSPGQPPGLMFDPVANDRLCKSLTDVIKVLDQVFGKPKDKPNPNLREGGWDNSQNPPTHPSLKIKISPAPALTLTLT